MHRIFHLRLFFLLHAAGDQKRAPEFFASLFPFFMTESEPASVLPAPSAFRQRCLRSFGCLGDLLFKPLPTLFRVKCFRITSTSKYQAAKPHARPDGDQRNLNSPFERNKFSFILQICPSSHEIAKPPI